MYSQLDRLLVEAEELNVEASSNNFNELPCVERNLSQVLTESREMRTRLQQPSDNQAVQANLLLSSCGVNLPQMSERLETISAQKPFELLESTVESDITTQINEKWQLVYLSMIEQNNRNVFQKIMQNSFQKETELWKKSLKSFIESCTCPSGNLNDFKIALKSSKDSKPVTKSVDRFALQIPPLRCLDTSVHSNYMQSNELEFAKTILKYNEIVVRGEPTSTNLFAMLRETVEKIPDAVTKDIWKLSEFMSHLPMQSNTVDRSSKITTAIIQRAKEFLEIRYRQFMENVVSENLDIANRGGIPGVLSLILAFVNVRFRNGYQDMIVEDQYDNRPLWPIIYYGLRAGDLKSVMFVLNSISNDRFVHLKAFIDHKHRKEESEYNSDSSYGKIAYKRLLEEFSLVRACADIYKRATYTVLVGTEPDEYLDSQLFKTTDDDLWCKLCLISSCSSGGVLNGLTFNKVQRIIFEECGESYYKPQIYFELLMLTGQFEAALEFLWRVDNSQKANAVHLAIAFNELNLLNTTRSVQAPMLQKEVSTDNTVCWLNLTRMIVNYTRFWEANEVLYALNYFFLLRHVPDIDNKNSFMVQVARLVTSTERIDEVYGKLEFHPIRQNAVRVNGLIDQFFMEPTHVTSLINYTAEELEKRGCFEQAIVVYNLADNEQKVLRLSCRFLSQILSLNASREETSFIKNRFLQYCRDILSQQFPESANTSGSQVVFTFHTLLKYADALELFASERLEESLSKISEMELVPKSMQDVEEKVNAVRNLSTEIRQLLPDVMLITMKILHSLSKNIEKNLTVTECIDFEQKSKLLKYYKDKAKAITNFSGMIPIVINEDISCSIIRLEIEMN